MAEAVPLQRRDRELLEKIRRTPPQSLAELAERTGRKKPNLSRTLKTMEHDGLVQISRHKRKLVPECAISGSLFSWSWVDEQVRDFVSRPVAKRRRQEGAPMGKSDAWPQTERAGQLPPFSFRNTWEKIDGS